MLDREQTIAHLVLDHSECATVLERHRIDFCCGGHQSLAAAASQSGVELDALVAELTRAIEARHGELRFDPRSLTTGELVSHIVEKHHEYTRKALPFVLGLAAKVHRVHGDKNPHLADLDQAVQELAAALGPHLDDEETSLFPTLTATAPDAHAIARLLEAMVDEHDTVAALLTRIRTAAEDFVTPDWACGSYRTLFSELIALERDIHTHVHLENHVLVPRFAS